MKRLHKPLATLAAALSLVACGPQEPTTTPEPVEKAQNEAARTPYQLDAAFAKAGADFGVPADLLKAISYTETRWEHVTGEAEFPGQEPAFGLMALRGAKLSEGARLAGVSEEAVRTQPEANIRAAAALLSAYAEELKLDRANLGAWAPAAVKLSGITHTEAQARYVHGEVYDILRKGAVANTLEGHVAVSLMPSEVQAQWATSGIVRAMSADYAPAIWRPSPNYGSRPSGYDISMIVIHTCEGGYSGCWSWLANSQSGASAHYVVNESGSEITQLVAETNRAWHVAASYDCGLNGSVMCGLNGQSVNNFSVGIEHGGYASQSSFPAGQIDASAKLSCDISRDRTVVRDSYHIVSHGRLQPATRTDPGPNWPWSTYITKIKEACGEGNIPTVGLVVDSNNANNDSTKATFTHSANWIAGANAGYYGNNYLYANAEAVSDPAVFSFYMAAAGSRTIDAWWVAGSNRSATAPFVIINSNGVNLGTVNVNQQLNGGKWNTLGTYNFTAGWNKIQLSRWTTAGTVVVADAIQVR